MKKLGSIPGKSDFVLEGYRLFREPAIKLNNYPNRGHLVWQFHTFRKVSNQNFLYIQFLLIYHTVYHHVSIIETEKQIGIIVKWPAKKTEHNAPLGNFVWNEDNLLDMYECIMSYSSLMFHLTCMHAMWLCNNYTVIALYTISFVTGLGSNIIIIKPQDLRRSMNKSVYDSCFLIIFTILAR